MNTPDILIIGGGVIGCSLARELARVRSQVVVLEGRRVGSGASSAAAGLLSPTFGPTPGGQLVELCRQSAALYPTWVEELRADGADEVGFRRQGLLHVCVDAEQAAQVRASLPDNTLPGRRAEWLDAVALRRREPALTEGVLGAAFFPDDAQVDPARLTQQVARVALLNGVQIREQEPVRLLERRGDRITAVHTNQGRYHPGVVVLTAGAWSGDLAGSANLQLPTRPVKGQLLLADCRTAPVQTPLHAGDTLLVPWPDGKLLLGVTVEEGAGFDEAVRLDSLRLILERVIALVPAVGRLPLSHAWAGLRPATPDGWPYLGPVPPLENLWISAGHFRKGILLAPVCARLLAASILAGHPVEELAPFQPTRRPVQHS